MNPGESLRRLAESGGLELPVPGAGATPERHRRLLQLAREDLPLARLAEAHTDATAILQEAGRVPRPSTLYGVWASDDPSSELHVGDATTAGDGRVLHGTKAFCSGAGIVDRALVTASTDHGPLLFDLDVREGDGVRFDTSGWISDAFAETRTAVTTFTGLRLDADAVVGPPGWYLDRVGFWHGACGPAACWAGGALGLVDWAIASSARRPPEPHRDAHLGAIGALGWSTTVALDAAGHEIDLEPADRDAAMRRALAVRHLVERACSEILDRIGRAMGPRPFAFDDVSRRRLAEVQLYIRQCHAERDLEALGGALREAARHG